MAQKVITELIDDITGQPADRTITFSVGRDAYEFDASPETAAEFKHALAGYIESARPAGKVTPVAKGGGNGRARMDREQTQAIREWAKKNGYSVADRGRIRAEVLAAYNSGAAPVGS